MLDAEVNKRNGEAQGLMMARFYNKIIWSTSMVTRRVTRIVTGYNQTQDKKAKEML